MLRFACLVVVLFLSGCVEQSDDYIRVNIDGNPVEFRTETYAYLYAKAGPIQSVNFGGKQSKAENTSQMNFMFAGAGLGSMGPGQYSNDVTACSYGGNMLNAQDDYENSKEHPCTITVTRMDMDRIEGTFSARLRRIDTDTVITLSDGRFSIAVKHD